MRLTLMTVILIPIKGGLSCGNCTISAIHLYSYVWGREGACGRLHGRARTSPDEGHLHVVEPELLLHIASGHLPECLLVVLHELEDGCQLLLLHSVGKRGQRERRKVLRAQGGRGAGGPALSATAESAFQDKKRIKPHQNALKAQRPQLEGSKSRL